ncbi:MAG: exosome complex RNA-binding protein Rrp4 [Thermoplasmata archaeon]
MKTEGKNETGGTEGIRELVIPGELLSEKDMQPGTGTYQEDDGKIYANQLGIKSVRDKFISVIPLNGRYNPRVNDTVIGKVIDVASSTWLFDINSPYPAPLHVTETPWRIDFGDTGRYLNVGDVVLLRVSEVDETKKVQVSMRGPGLRKLTGGAIIEISPPKIPRVIGKNASMISVIQKYTNCKLHVGQNGRIWIDGSIEKIEKVIEVVKKIEKEAHTVGLTESITKYLSVGEKT